VRGGPVRVTPGRPVAEGGGKDGPGAGVETMVLIREVVSYGGNDEDASTATAAHCYGGHVDPSAGSRTKRYG